MDDSKQNLEEEVLRLYREPIIGASYANTYGEENIQNLVEKYRSLDPKQMETMRGILTEYSQSMDLGTSYVSVGTLHALGMKDEVEAAYAWAGKLEESSKTFTHHFDVGKSLADYFFGTASS